MKQTLARILCLSTILLLLNSITFSFLQSDNLIKKNSKTNKTELTQKNDACSLLFNENEEIDSFDDDEDEKELHSMLLIVSNNFKQLFSSENNLEITHCSTPELPILKPTQIWLKTRKLII